MGYRSELTILTSGETDKLEAFKQAMLLRYRNKNTLDLVKDCLGANEGDRFCDCEYWDNSGFAYYCSAFHDIKWYTEAQEWFNEYKELSDEAGISVEFMRVGEEPSDVEHLHNEACDETGGCMLYTETTIRVSGRD